MIKELENRLQAVMTEVDRTAKARNAVEREKMDLDSKLDRVMSDFKELKDRYIIILVLFDNWPKRKFKSGQKY